MNVNEAIDFTEPAIDTDIGTWADIGAGSGLFTMAICALIPGVHIYAVDKSPHMLWTLEPQSGCRISVVEGDFNRQIDIPKVGGMIMANALHYAPEPEQVLDNVLGYLKPGGTFLLIEYETDTPNQWVPYPLRFQRFREVCEDCGLSEPEVLGTRPTLYGHQHMYLARSIRC